MPTSPPPDTLVGHQLPRRSSYPAAASSAGREAIALAEHAGLHLFPWQQHVLDVTLGERADGKWAAFEVGLVVPRQNGKGAILEALELAHLFLFGSELVIHSAHRQDTSAKHQQRLWTLISQTPDLLGQVRDGKNYTGNGKEKIVLRSGAEIRFSTRTKDGGRGLSGDLVVLDEAMDLPHSVMAALMPTMRARPNPQLWYVGSPVDQEKDADGFTLTEVRNRALGDEPDPGLCYCEWSAGEWQDFVDGLLDLDDRDRWAMSNPSLGYLIEAEHMAKERRAMRAVPRSFVIELLGVGDWPSPEAEESRVIDLDAWDRLKDTEATFAGSFTLAVEADPAMRKFAISAGGTTPAGRSLVECIEFLPGSGWVVPRLLELVADWDPEAIVIDEKGPAAGLIPAIEQAGLEVTRAGVAQHTRGCATFLTRAEDGTLAHLGQPEMNAAIQSAGKRDVGDLWAWARRGSAGLQPLVAGTLALDHHVNRDAPPAPPPPVVTRTTPTGDRPGSRIRRPARDLTTARW